MKERLLIVTSAQITSGTTVILNTNAADALYDGERFLLKFMLTGQDKEDWRTLLQRNEIVSVTMGTGASSVSVVATDFKGDVLYSDKLFLHKTYCLRYGNNGPISQTAAGLKHMMFLNARECPNKGFNSANTATIPI